METAAPPATAAVMGEYPTISVHSAKAVDAGAPARQDAEAGVEPSPPEADALEGREGSNPSASGDARGESPVEEEARDEPAADEASTPLVEKDAKSSKSSSSKSRSRSKSASRSKRSGRSGKRTKAPSFSQKMMEKAGIVAVEKKTRSSSKGRSSSKSTTRKTGDRSLSKSATRKKQDAGKSGKTLKKVEMKPEEKTGEKKSGRGRTMIKEMSVRARSKSKNRSDSIVDLGEGKVSVNGNTFKKAEKIDSTPKTDDEEKKESGRGRSIIKEMSARARSKSKNRSESIAEEKPEQKVEEEKSKSDEKASIKDGAKAKLGSFRGKLSSPTLLKKSSKKVDTAPVADDENKSTKSTRSLKSLLSRRSNKTSESAADGPSTSPEEAEARAEDSDAGEAVAAEAETEARAVSPIEDTGADEAQAVAEEEEAASEGRAPSPMESIAKSIQELLPSSDASVTPSVTESVAKSIREFADEVGNVVVGQCFGLASAGCAPTGCSGPAPGPAEVMIKMPAAEKPAEETEDESLQDVLEEGLAPTEVNAEELKEENPVEESS